eukprot:SM000245S08164  [mRNA]  locus=s245:176262:177179:+ [translate_table: standard]
MAAQLGAGGLFASTAPPALENAGIEDSAIGIDAVKVRAEASLHIWEAFYSAADKVYSAAAAAGSTLGVTDGDEDGDRREPERGTLAAGLGSGGCVEDPGPSNGEWRGECGVAGEVGPSDAGSDKVLVGGGPAGGNGSGGGLEDDIQQPTEAGPKLGADSCVGGVPDTMQM